jgi:hypothetical protein
MPATASSAAWTPELPRIAIERATRLILEIAGGTPGPVIEAVLPQHLPQAAADRAAPRAPRARARARRSPMPRWSASCPRWAFAVEVDRRWLACHAPRAASISPSRKT